MVKIAPSLLAADFANLERDIRELEDNDIDILHLDIMDGTYVPNITFGAPLIRKIREKTDMIFDAHMMVQYPDHLIKDLAEAGVDVITIHPEATKHLHRSLQIVKSHGVKPGVALNPSTPIDVMEYVLDDIEVILLMTVNPGFGGQDFIPVMPKKIARTKEMIKDYNIEIEIDGGINHITGKKCIEAGADILITGSYLFDGNVKENIRRLREA